MRHAAERTGGRLVCAPERPSGHPLCVVHHVSHACLGGADDEQVDDPHEGEGRQDLGGAVGEVDEVEGPAEEG